jgi:hypothetical protein
VPSLATKKKRDAHHEANDENDEEAIEGEEDSEFEVQVPTKKVKKTGSKPPTTTIKKKIKFFNGVLIDTDHKVFVDCHGSNCTTKRLFGGLKINIESFKSDATVNMEDILTILRPYYLKQFKKEYSVDDYHVGEITSLLGVPNIPKRKTSQKIVTPLNSLSSIDLSVISELEIVIYQKHSAVAESDDGNEESESKPPKKAPHANFVSLTVLENENPTPIDVDVLVTFYYGAYHFNGHFMADKKPSSTSPTRYASNCSYKLRL